MSGVSWEKGHHQGLCSLNAAEVQEHSDLTPKPQLPETISFLYKTPFSLLTGLHREKKKSLYIQSKQLCLIPNHSQELRGCGSYRLEDFHVSSQ